MHKMGNYSTHRVKPRSQNTTSQLSHNDCNKFQVKSLKTENYIQSHYTQEQPSKLVIPVPDKAKRNSPSKSPHTHHLTAKSNARNDPRKQKAIAE